MSASLDTDVLIIGGGLFGCATAYFLAQFGVETLVVDAGDIGAEASAANAGNLHLQLAPSTHAAKDPDWVREFAEMMPIFLGAVDLWQDLARELPRDIELRFPGGIMVAENERQMAILRDKAALEQENGLAVELLDQAALLALAPYVSEQMIGASYCPGEGMANALLALIALRESAQANGARFLSHARVEGLEGQMQWLAKTTRGPIRSRRVVIAAGANSHAVSQMVGVSLPLTCRAIHITATEPCARFIDHLLYHTERRLTLKQSANGNVMIGGGWSATIDPVFGRPAVLHDSLRQSLWVAQHVVPRSGHLHVIRAWAGRNVYTPDGKPILGAVPSWPGLYVAVCNTYGFTLGPFCARFVAEQIAGRPPARDLAAFSIERFRPMAINRDRTDRIE
jgi:glycine/D-amino acid oxidase-like deaminating enzyme